EIVLTGGGTESNNLAIYGAAGSARGGRLVTSAIEHPSVLGAFQDLEARGFEVVRVPPTRNGVVEPEAVLEAAGPGTRLVSLMLANNEIGTLQPVAVVGRALARRGVLFHCDAAQAAGKIPLVVADLAVDLMSIAGHKFGGPQGTGALYVRRGLVLQPHLRGGGQELNRRPGTENVAGIAGLGAAAAAAGRDLLEETARIAGLRDRLERAVLSNHPEARVNGSGAPRVPNTASLSFDGMTGEALVIALDLEGFAVSAGSACSAGTIRRSHVLEAMGLSDAALSSIRISLGHGTTPADIEGLIAALGRVLERARPASVVAPGRGTA
ncbi:MAG TPA: cysteine desulfurase family protein, partial [Candidatus Polarisedimenticolia bacterium]|nr:cysteine desulfurase family protein [Candidatus Polarisedimenticolia bacterium]